jgi:hypothetical protein
VYAGSVIIIAWGIAHIVRVTRVVAGFGILSADNQRIIAMEWVQKDSSLFYGNSCIGCHISGGLASSASILVIRALAILLFVLAGRTAMTGARTAIIPVKYCPLVKTACAVLFIAGTATCI